MSNGSLFTAGQRITAAALNNAFPHLVDYVATASSSGTFTTVETVILTSDSITFVKGRAYQVIFFSIGVSTIAADQLTLAVKKTNTSGLQVAVADRLVVPANNQTAQPIPAVNYISNTTGADITAVLVGTAVRRAGTGTCSTFASTSSPTYLLVNDVGLASDYPGAVAIT